jgi:UDP-2,4-diacetamido-2,4,6-trideoxy-beta-L-altropyranose hydrolase
MSLGFYVNASKKIGSGHWHRCMNIAEIVNIKKTYFFSHKYLSIKDKNIKLIKIKNNNLSLCKSLIKQKINTLIIDDYNFSISRQNKVRNYVQNTIAIDDNFNKKYSCNLIINYSFAKRKKVQYLKKKNFRTKLALGIGFLPLNKNIVKIKKKAKIRKVLNKILIFFGGSYQKKLYEKMLKVISQFNEILFYIVGNESDLINIKNKKLKNTKFFHNIENSKLCKIMKDCDLAIGSGGFNLYERIFLGLPSITLLLNKSQSNNINFAEREKLIFNLGHYKSFSINNLINKIKIIQRNKRLLKKISMNCFKHFKNYNNLNLKKIILNDSLYYSSTKK